MRGQRVDPRVPRHHLEEGDEGLVELGEVVGRARVEVGHADDGVCATTARQSAREKGTGERSAAMPGGGCAGAVDLSDRDEDENGNEHAAKTRVAGPAGAAQTASGAGRGALTDGDDKEEDREGVGDGDDGLEERRDDLAQGLEAAEEPDDPERPNQSDHAAHTRLG